jgi:pimeloyl-ACP methyl ester carboxylesterase
LLRTASALGFTAVALDRPGYGASAPHAESFHDPRRRSELAYALIDRLVPPGARGAGIALLAHSAGCEPAVRMAAEPRGASLLGVSLAGTGLRHPPDTAARLAAARERKTPTKVRDLLWEPARLHPSDVIGGAGMLFPSPAYEGDVVDTWAARDFAALAARVRVPVQFVHAEHENVWQSDPDSLAEVAALFRAAPRVELVEQRGAGHNLSVAHTATAYHLKVLSFVEECVVARGLGETDTAGFGKALS